MDRFFRLTKKFVLTAAVLAVLSATADQARADGFNPNLHYVAVGVSKVPSLPDKNQLRFAHKDALDLAKTWKAQEAGMYKKVYGETLIDENAKGADILAALDRLLEKAQKGDTAVVSLCGHGGVTGGRGSEWFFVANDFDPTRFDQTILTASTIRAKLAKLSQRGVTVILLLDTCHSGAFGAEGSGIIIFAACGASQSSIEDLVDGPFQNGYFTRALIEGLGGKADYNGDGVVTLAELEKYVVERVAEMHKLQPAIENGQRYEQNPTLARPTSVASELALVGGAVQLVQPINPERPDRMRPPLHR